MQMQRHPNELEGFCDQLRSIADTLAKNPPQRIGYRERVLIEGPLFLVMKEFCRRRFGYDLHGFSEENRRRLEGATQGDASVRRPWNLVREAFEVRSILLALSGTNPYVQGDALSRTALTKRDTVALLSRSLHRLARRAIDDNSE
jgi:hypothetical protein